MNKREEDFSLRGTLHGYANTDSGDYPLMEIHSDADENKIIVHMYGENGDYVSGVFDCFAMSRLISKFERKWGM